MCKQIYECESICDQKYKRARGHDLENEKRNASTRIMKNRHVSLLQRTLLHVELLTQRIAGNSCIRLVAISTPEKERHFSAEI